MEPITLAYILLSIIVLIIVVRIVRFFRKLAAGICNGVREAFHPGRPGPHVMREECCTMYATSRNRYYAPQQGGRSVYQPVDYIQSAATTFPKYDYPGHRQLPGPRVIIDPQQNEHHWDYEFEPCDVMART
jgi:hypothetical protein